MTDTTIENADLSVTISDLGAETQRIRMADGRDLLWSGDAAFWTGRSPILFPIVGRAPGGRIAVNGHEAEMGQHGFARRSRFALEVATPTLCRHVLTDTEESRAIYPFAFRLAVTHAIEAATLGVRVEVTNLGQTPMPFGFGFHPAFLWPLPGSEGHAHAITLENGAEPPLARLDDGYLSSELLPSPFRAGRLELHHRLFEHDALIFPEGTGNALRYAAEGGDAPSIRFRFENTPNLGIWTKPGAPYICIEPWHGMATKKDAGPDIAARPSSMELAAGATERFGYSASVA